MDQNIQGYTNDDVNIVLMKVFENAINDRDEAKELLKDIKQKIVNKSADSLFLIEKANSILETINKQNDVLVRLSGVMQRLQTNLILGKQKKLLDDKEYNKLLEALDESEKKLENKKENIKLLDEKKENKDDTGY